MVCVSLNGSILTHTEEPLLDQRPANACKQVGKLVRKLCQQLDEKQLLLSGVGVCLPGAVDESVGLVRLAPNLGWRDVPFQTMLHTEFARLGIAAAHIHLQNDADAAALGEYEFGGGSSDDPLIFVNCDVGVGAGIVLNDRLFTGFLGSAGEIGHSILQVEGPLCSCGRRGCAEAYVGARALAHKSGLAQAGQYLGVLLQNLDAMFNPHVIVVGGRSCMEHPGLIASARSTQQAYAAAAGLQAPEVRAARFGLQAAAVGAAALVLHHFLRPLFKESKHVPGN
jgi:predicted NBD/HSP70 family sugar kinase